MPLPSINDSEFNLLKKLVENTAQGGGGGAVSSVNGQTGAVVLTAPDIGAAAAFPLIGSTCQIFVSKGGNDTTGTGTPNAPYLTIGKALAVIGANADGSQAKPYVVSIGPGIYAENVVTRPWTFLFGSTKTSPFKTGYSTGAGIDAGGATIINGLVSPHASFATEVFCYYGISNLCIAGSALDFGLMGIGGAGKSVGQFQNLFAGKYNGSDGLLSYIGRGTGQDVAVMDNLYSQAGAHLKNAYMLISNGLMDSGFSTGQTSGGTADITIRNCRVLGNLTLDGDPSDATRVRFLLGANQFLGNWTQSDFATLKTDSVSLPKVDQVTLSPNFDTTLINDAYGIGYTPSLPDNWQTLPATIQEALDGLTDHIPFILNASSTLNFASILAGGFEDKTITVFQAAANDCVVLGLPAAANSGIVFEAFVSADDTVTVRAHNVSLVAVDPASATYRVTVLHIP